MEYGLIPHISETILQLVDQVKGQCRQAQASTR